MWRYKYVIAEAARGVDHNPQAFPSEVPERFGAVVELKLKSSIIVH